MKRIANIFKLDFQLSLKDSVTLYSLLSPILLAVILALVLPGSRDIRINFAVGPSVTAEMTSQLEAYGRVQTLDSRQAVEQRVMEFDEIAGVCIREGQYRVILQGNERSFDAPLISAIVEAAGATSAPTASAGTVSTRNLEGSGNFVTSYAAVMMVMLGLLIGGLLTGFNIVDEKESGVIRALAVSPLRIWEYIGARGIFTLIIGVVSATVALVILTGFGIDYVRYIPAVLVAVVVALPFGFIIGGFADNQMTAFALVKLLMAVFLTLPFISIFIPRGFQWIFYPLPNYWMFIALSNAIVGETYTPGTYLVSLTAALISGLMFITILIPSLRKRLSLR